MADDGSQSELVPVETIGTRYRLQRARFERVATFVAERCAALLRSEGIRHLLSFRAKHPDDVTDKVLRKRRQGKGDYERIGEDMNLVLHDLAGVRVVVYDPRDEERVAKVILKAFRLCDGPPEQVHFARPDYGRRDRATDYSATHLVVTIEDGPESSSIAGARCEVQICNVAAHLYNELEHDIRYKKKRATPTRQTTEALEHLRKATRALEEAATELSKRHARDVLDQSTEILDASDLSDSVRAAMGIELQGDFQSLFRVLRSVISPLTVRSIELADSRRPSLQALKAYGAEVATRLSREADDVIQLALGLSEEFRDEFRAVADGWEGERSALVDALAAATHDE